MKCENCGHNEFVEQPGGGLFETGLLLVCRKCNKVAKMKDAPLPEGVKSKSMAKRLAFQTGNHRVPDSNALTGFKNLIR